MAQLRSDFERQKKGQAPQELPASLGRGEALARHLPCPWQSLGQEEGWFPPTSGQFSPRSPWFSPTSGWFSPVLATSLPVQLFHTHTLPVSPHF